MTEAILDPSGTLECPEILSTELRDDLIGDTIHRFAWHWASMRVPGFAGGPSSYFEFGQLSTDWFDALCSFVESFCEIFDAAIDESISRLLREARTVGAFVVPEPSAQLYGVSHVGAERLVADWMHHLGDGGASVTQTTGDGGVDVRSDRYIAQVKNYSENVGVEPIRELAGVAAVEGLPPLFFAARGYAPGAVRFADRSGVALFVYDAQAGTLEGANVLGRRIRQAGLGLSQ